MPSAKQLPKENEYESAPWSKTKKMWLYLRAMQQGGHMLRMSEISLAVSRADGTTSSFYFGNCRYYGSGVEQRSRNSSLLAFGYAPRAGMVMKEVLYAAH